MANEIIVRYTNGESKSSVFKGRETNVGSIHFHSSKFSKMKKNVSTKFNTILVKTKQNKKAGAILGAVKKMKTSANDKYGDKYRSYKKKLSNHAQHIRKDAENFDFCRMIIGEIIGNFVILLFERGASFKNVGQPMNILDVALCSGFCYMIFLYCLQDCHILSPLSIGLAFLKEISGRHLFVHLCSQFVGAFCGSIALNWISNVKEFNYDYITLSKNTSNMDAILVEAMSSFIFVFFSFFAFVKKLKTSNSYNLEPIVSGLALIAVSLVAIPFTGCSLNPLKSLALAITSNNWSYLWIYLSAPCIGGVLAAVAYKLLFSYSVVLKLFKKMYLKMLNKEGGNSRENSYVSASDNIYATQYCDHDEPFDVDVLCNDVHPSNNENERRRDIKIFNATPHEDDEDSDTSVEIFSQTLLNSVLEQRNSQSPVIAPRVKKRKKRAVHWNLDEDVMQNFEMNELSNKVHKHVAVDKTFRTISDQISNENVDIQPNGLESLLEEKRNGEQLASGDQNEKSNYLEPSAEKLNPEISCAVNIVINKTLSDENESESEENMRQINYESDTTESQEEN